MSNRRGPTARRWRIAVTGLLATGLALGAWLTTQTLAQDEDEARVPSRATRRSPSAAGKNTGLQGKFEKAFANQQAMLTRLDEIMAELQIIKIRATR